ncbi:hypothetical protein Hden_0658 [Hyphomicrobium denitrificans ATCC 51888]|uniref:DUF4935 domain-containing protein n=1 Tax=Hyphomicrobium denitrificans (strain ATCC 51888 / DSM 1869 / NCIMB 11706 / TK 0415) TaxID=582899 RepID=D8JSZ4_HYPDA|nr:hypothetical protein [Hyphomicrobium denitrificans]ADJ22479.1 hypothetical protein Hden_0658 [Hyphomicrobium denitrificans ATCC 51888]
MTVPRLTIDANCVINVFDPVRDSATSVDELRALIRYAMENKVEIAVTTRLEADLLRDRNEMRRAKLLSMLEMFPIVSTVGRWDVSIWDGDVFADKRTARLNDEIQQIIFPGLTPADARYSNKINDVDHLTGHVIDCRDIFVTDDRGILRRRDQLRHGPGVVVMTPAEALAHVDHIVLRSTPRTLPTDGISPDYHSRALRGVVAFDYTNNNHRYALGEAQHLFETMWSKASNVAIYAYTDAPSIDALALAKGAVAISKVTDAEAFDYSSRVRTANLGQIILWRNVNGLYGATRVVGIKDDSRGDAINELIFEYVLLPDGSRDFSGSGLLP